MPGHWQRNDYVVLNLVGRIFKVKTCFFIIWSKKSKAKSWLFWNTHRLFLNKDIILMYAFRIPLIITWLINYCLSLYKNVELFLMRSFQCIIRSICFAHHMYTLTILCFKFQCAFEVSLLDFSLNRFPF